MLTFDNPVALLFGGLIMLLFVVALLILRALRIKSPTVQAVVDALIPFVYKAIVAGEKIALSAMTDFDKQLAGQDKKKVADSVYDALPDYLLVGGFPMPIKAVKWMVPREQFEVLVRNVYEETHVYIMKNEAFLSSQIDDLLADNKQADAPPAPPDQAAPPAPPPALPPQTPSNILKTATMTNTPAADAAAGITVKGLPYRPPAEEATPIPDRDG